MKDFEIREFKKFVMEFLNPYFEEISAILKMEDYDTLIVGEMIGIIFRDIGKISEEI